MSRTVTVLFDSRAEAEAARERLASDLGAQALRIIGKGTLAAVDSLDIEKKRAIELRQALRRDAHVVVAQVPRGTSPARVAESLGLSAVQGDKPRTPNIAPLRHGIEKPTFPVAAGEDIRVEPAPRGAAELPPGKRLGSRSEDAQNADCGDQAAVALERSIPPATRALKAPYSCFTEEEVEAAGLFKERTIDFAEMREEAVVTKETFVREEVIVTKTVKERIETIRDSVRHTEFEVEPLGPR